MSGVDDELAAHSFLLLQALCHLVERASQRGHFVRARQSHARLIFASGHSSRRPGDVIERPCQPKREQRGEQQAHDGGDRRSHEKYGHDAVVEHRVRRGSRLAGFEHQPIEGGLSDTEDADCDDGQRYRRHQEAQQCDSDSDPTRPPRILPHCSTARYPSPLTVAM